MTDDATRQIEQPEPVPGATPAPGAAPGAPPAAGANRARWAIGLGIAGLAIVAVIAAVLTLGSRPTPPALTYIPADAVLVVELRPDLPGDQLQKLGNLLAHFPGFADQSTLPDKLDESFTQLLGRASGGSVDYRADIKPWLSGPAFVALLPPTDATADDPKSFLHGVASLTTTGTVTCESLLEGSAVTHETYRSLDLVIDPGGASACVVDGTQALIGDTASVRKALDVHADGTAIDKDASYQEARASLQGDQLQAMYLRGAGYMDVLEKMMGLTPGAPDMTGCFPAAFPAWMAQGLRSEDDALVIDAVVEAAPAPTAGATAGASLLPIPPAHPSAVLPFAPANTVVLFESQGIGVNLQNSIAMLRGCPTYGPALDMLDQAGDPAEFLGWIEDVGLIVTGGDGGVAGGLVVVTRDAASATERVATLKGLFGLAELGGVDIETRDATIGGVTVTTVTISNLGSFVPPGQLPPGVALPDDAVVEFSIATKDRTILLAAGAGETFMTAALTVQPGAGLADAAAYKAATSRALPSSQATLYVAIREIVGLVEPLIPAEAQAQWATEIKPYVAPFQALSMTSAADGTGSGRSRVTLTIRNP
jgi:hypothetical protein